MRPSAGRLGSEHDRPGRPARFEFTMGVPRLLQREPGVDPGCQLSAGSRRERVFGVIALLGQSSQLIRAVIEAAAGPPDG